MHIDQFDEGSADGSADEQVSAPPEPSPLARTIDSVAARFPDEVDAVQARVGAEETAKELMEPEIGDDGLPTSYRLQPVEGMSIDRELLKEATPVFRDLKLSNGQANRLMPLAHKLMDRTLRSLEADHAKAKSLWAQQAKSDPDIGGAKWSQTQRLIKQAYDAAGITRGSPFLQLLDRTGLGNHPEMIRIFRALGARLSASGRGTRFGPQAGREETRYPED